MSLFNEMLQCPTPWSQKKAKIPITSILKRSYTTWSCLLLASLISFPNTLPTTYSALVTMALLVFLQHIRLPPASGFVSSVPELLFPGYILATFLTSLAQMELSLWSLPWLPYLKCSPLLSPYSQIFSILLYFSLFPPYHLSTYQILYNSLPYYTYCLVSISLPWKLSRMRADIFVYFVHQYIPSIYYSHWQYVGMQQIFFHWMD